MAKGQLGVFEGGWQPMEPLEEHAADSKWQYCLCGSCQSKRHLLETLPGVKIDFNTFRLPGERY